jgi:xanthine dehydrogenase YagS FAD-binding subunit
MNPFSYTRATDLASAVGEAATDAAAMFIAGGTNLIDLMKEGVTRPNRLIDVTRLPLTRIEETENGGLRLGALVTNAATNMATHGGNLLQRTRCYYFYDTATPCNKRAPGSGCAAIDGYNRMHAVLGASEQCIAVHPSDMCVALAALDAVVRITGTNGERTVPLVEFHRLPGDTPHVDTVMRQGDVITAIDLPPQGFPDHYAYLKIRDRQSYAFALVSVAAALALDGDTIVEMRLALGGVAHKPWRDPDAEAMLVGRTATAEQFRDVAAAVMRSARGRGHNTFKIELAKRAIVRALTTAARLERHV